MSGRITTTAKTESSKVGTKQQAVATSAAPQNGQPTVEDEIRLGAYLKWEAAGRPSGDGTEFWLLAEKELSPQTQEHGH